jgi:hypothetical protein
MNLQKIRAELILWGSGARLLLAEQSRLDRLWNALGDLVSLPSSAPKSGAGGQGSHSSDLFAALASSEREENAIIRQIEQCESYIKEIIDKSEKIERKVRALEPV